MGNPLIIAIVVVVFAATLVILNKIFANRSAKYTKRSLENISRENDFDLNATSHFMEDDEDKFGESVLEVPILGNIYRKLKKSGTKLNLLTYLILLIVIFAVVTYLVTLFTKGVVLIGFFLGLFAVFMFNATFLGIKLEKRNEMFLNDFPDAIDMIVRSVRSGHPLLVSLKLIAQNSRPPLSIEFQRVLDEVSYGRPLPEALRKMADRIDILDVNFFVVILSVQQETGGSMAEVLSNLSNIIRKRKQLRLKIRALTAEGRITTWIFSAIPFIQIGAVYFIARDYLDPLFNTSSGLMCLAASVAMIGFAIYISRQLCKMDI